MSEVVLMTDAIPDLGLLDRSPSARNFDLASELFHRINRVIPQSQSLLEIAPKCSVRDAVALMRKHGYSQVPVVDKGTVLGVFSFRSFAHEVATATLDDWTNQKCAPGDLCVDEFLEQFEFARVTEEMSRVFDAMDKDNGVLIGTPDRLVGILTPMDFLRYLYTVASPFIMVSEIELALRSDAVASNYVLPTVTPAVQYTFNTLGNTLRSATLILATQVAKGYQSAASQGMFEANLNATSKTLNNIQTILNSYSLSPSQGKTSSH